MGDSGAKNTDPLRQQASDTDQPVGATSLLETSELEEGHESRAQFDDSGLSTQLQSGLESLRVEQSLTDVILHVEGREFPCHRVVLAAASHYFRAMFCNDLREKREEQIHIKGVEAETMAVLLDYTYTSKVLITKQNVQKILEAASLFQVPPECFFCVDIATVLRKARLSNRPSESAVPELQSHFMSY